MADNKTLRLEIVVDDKGTPVIKGFASEVQRAADTMERRGNAAADKLSGGLQRTTDQAGRATTGMGNFTKSTSAAADVMDRQGAASVNKMREGLSSLDGAFSKMIKSGAGIAAGFAGFNGVASVVTNAFNAMKSFDAEMANVNTLLDEGSVSIDQLRQEIIKLPPELGTTTELAQGLYQALSAGVEPAKAVAFVGDAAKLAKAGLTEANTAVSVLTTAMDAYGLSANQATEVSDILFTAVKLGKTTMGELASTIGTVLPISASLGVSLQETVATVTTLTKIMPTTSQAVTSYRDIMGALIQNMDKFKAVGIDIKQVIAERGLTGAIEAMKQATGGQVEKIRELIPNVEGLTGMVGLMGEQFTAQKKHVDAMTESLGATDEAAKKVQSSFEKSAERLANSWDRLVQKAAPATFGLLSILADAAKQTIDVQELYDKTLGKMVQSLTAPTAGMQALAHQQQAVADQAAEMAKALDTALDSIPQMVSDLQDTREQFDAFMASLNGTSIQTVDLTEQTKALAAAHSQEVTRLGEVKAGLEAMGRADLAAKISTEALAASTDTVAASTTNLAEVFASFNQKTPAELQTAAAKMATHFAVYSKAGVASQDAVADAAKKTVAAIEAAYGKQIPVALQATYTKAKQLSEGVTELERTYATFGQQTPLELYQAAQKMAGAWDKMRTDGIHTNDQLQDASKKTVAALEAAFGKDIPDAFKHTYEQAKELAKGVDATTRAYAEFGLKTPKMLKEALDDGVKAFRTLQAQSDTTKEALQASAKDVLDRLRDVYGEKLPYHVRMGFADVIKTAQETVDPITTAGTNAGKGFATGIQEGASEAMKALDALLAEADAAFNALNNKAAIEKRNAAKNGTGSSEGGTTPDTTTPDTDPYQLKGNFGLGDRFAPIEQPWATTEAGLQAQLVDYRQQYTNVANGRTITGDTTIGTRGYREAMLPVLTEILAEGERRLKELTDDATDALERAATGSTGTTSRRGGTTSSTSTAQGVGRSAGRADATEGLVMRQTPLGGGSLTIGRGRGYDPDFVQGHVPVDYNGILLPSNVLETNAAGASYTRQGDVLRPGNGEVLLSKDLAEGLRQLVAQGGTNGSHTVQIHNPSFTVEQIGIDPRAVDGRAIVAAILPAMREAIRRGELQLA